MITSMQLESVDSNVWSIIDIVIANCHVDIGMNAIDLYICVLGKWELQPIVVFGII